MRAQMQALESNFNSLLKLNLEEYSGSWIAIFKGHVIANGEDLKEVYTRAKQTHPKDEVLFSKVPEDAPLLL